MRVQHLLIVLLLSSCVATTACGCRFAKDEVVVQMGRKVETELPLGSTPAQVTKFLGDMHIENRPGGLQIMDTHRYDGLEQVEGNVYSYLRDTPLGTSSSFFGKVNSSNGGSRVTAVVDVIPCARANLHTRTPTLAFVTVTNLDDNRLMGGAI